MKLLGSALTLTAYFALYSVIHSWLASLPVKRWVREKTGPTADRWYRLAYNVFAAVTLLPMLALVGLLPNKTLYVASAPWRWLMLGGQLLALLGAGFTLLQTGVWHFLGLAQLVDDNPTETTSLNLRGFYRWVRHPLYTFSLIFLWLTPLMTFNNLVGYLLFTLYFYIGSEHEERRMIREYGQSYERYRQAVPRLIPLPGYSYTPQETRGEA